MCTITDESHVHLGVPAEDRREIARILLGAVELVDGDPANPCTLTSTTDGFRIVRAVFDASGLGGLPDPEGLADMLTGLGERARAARAEGDEDSAGPARGADKSRDSAAAEGAGGAVVGGAAASPRRPAPPKRATK